MSRRRPHARPTPTALLDVARAEGNLAEVEDELFRFARVLEGNDELRTTLTDPHLPVEPAPADRRGPPRRQGQPGHHRRWSSMVVGTGRARDLPAIIDELVQPERRRGQQGGGRGPLGRRAHRRPEAAAWPPPSSKATGKQVELKVDHRPVRARRPRRPGRRHGHRRLGPDPPRAAQAPRSRRTDQKTPTMAELTINTADIAAALQQEPRGLHARHRRRAGRPGHRGGRRHRPRLGPPRRRRQRAARVRGRHPRPGPEPRRGVDRRRGARRRRRRRARARR